MLDTPGGLRGFDLARVVAFADVIVMPVCNSVFDRESAAECSAEMMALPRVASGRCKVAAVGMRLDARTRARRGPRRLGGGPQDAFIGVLRETQGYVRCVEQGLTLFDLPAAQAQADIAQWQPMLEWLEPVLYPAPRADASIDANGMRLTYPCHVPVERDAANRRVTARAAEPALVDVAASVVEAVVAAGPVRVSAPTRIDAPTRTDLPIRTVAPQRARRGTLAGLLGWLHLPRFRQRNA